MSPRGRRARAAARSDRTSADTPTGQGEGGQGRREVMDRAIRRLGVLEQLFLAMAAVAALVAGALVAWLLGQAFSLPFRPTWAVSALLLFIVPGALSYWRIRRDEQRRARIIGSPSDVGAQDVG